MRRASTTRPRRTSRRCARRRRSSSRTRRRSTSTGCAWARTSRPASPPASRSTSTSSDVIKKHERTRRDKEDDRTRHIVELRAQTGVVFLTYRATRDVDAVVGRASPRRAALRLHARRRRAAHDLARATADARALVDAFARYPALYIADGHHRAASAARARAALQTPGRRRQRRSRDVHRRRVSRTTRCRSCRTTGR